MIRSHTKHIILWAFILHTIWEFVQCIFLYDMWDWPFLIGTLWVWAAIFGDILIVLSLWKGTITLVPIAQFESPGLKGYLVLLSLSFVASICLEWVALYLNLWQYTTAMPVVSIFDHEVGLSPIFQITLLPALCVYLANKFQFKS